MRHKLHIVVQDDITDSHAVQKPFHNAGRAVSVLCGDKRVPLAAGHAEEAIKKTQLRVSKITLVRAFVDYKPEFLANGQNCRIGEIDGAEKVEIKLLLIGRVKLRIADNGRTVVENQGLNVIGNITGQKILLIKSNE